MSIHQKLILILLILSINTILSLIYLIYGINKTNKINQKNKKKDTKSEDSKEESSDPEHPTKKKYTKYVILSIFMITCPIVGILFLSLGHFFFSIFFDSSIDLAAITFSKKRVDIIERPDVESEINLVPMEEAIMIEDKQNLRNLLLTVLRGDMTKSISAVTKALNSTDSEASHYAASAIMDITNEFQKTIQKFQVQLEGNPDDAEINLLFIDYLCKMLAANFLSEMELKTYIYTLNHTCENMYNHNKEKMNAIHYCNLIRFLLKIGDIQLAQEWLNRLTETFSDDIEMYRCVLQFYYETKDKKNFFIYLDKLKHSNISIDKDLLELIRLFN